MLHRFAVTTVILDVEGRLQLHGGACAVSQGRC